MVPDALQDSVCDEQLIGIDGEFALSEKKTGKIGQKIEKTKIGKKNRKKKKKKSKKK